MKRAIVHFDGDSFFASVEQVMNFRLKGKPILTGGERGAITSVSVEAKKMGLGRGLSLADAKKICPEVVVVSSSYLTYSIFAERMYAIVREFTPHVEEYSIDECFADITFIKNVPYEETAQKIKKRLEESLGITFGVGLGPNKVLAKAASKYRKPGGFTSVELFGREEFLKNIPVGALWGVGPSSSKFLQSEGIKTAFDFSLKDERWLHSNRISLSLIHIWQELRGNFSYRVEKDEKHVNKSVISSGTFRPATNKRHILLRELSCHAEEVCQRVRLYGRKGRYLRFYLKTSDFRYRSFDFALSIPLSTPNKIMELIEENFDQVYRRGELYRATGISLSGLLPEEFSSFDLFGEVEENKKNIAVFSVVDSIDKRFGRETMRLASSIGEQEEESFYAKEKYKAPQLIYKEGRPLRIPLLGIVQ